MGSTRRELLWTCPACGAKLVTKNMWHSCGRGTLEDWKARMGPRARALYDRFEQMIAACGEYRVAAAKARIAFKGRVRFASITRISEEGMTCDFALPRALDARRFTNVTEIDTAHWIHQLRVTDPAQLDDELHGWLRESYRQMGMQDSDSPSNAI